MTNPNPPRSLTRVWLGVLAIVVLALIVYMVTRPSTAPVETRTDSVPTRSEQFDSAALRMTSALMYRNHTLQKLT